MVDQDAKDVSEMVQAAKYGQWPTVYSILDRKPYLVNCIPEERSWAALHQSAWWENESAVRKLLSYPACDSLVKTKEKNTNESGPGKTPEWVARYIKSNEIIANILEEFTQNERQKRFAGEIPTYVTAQDGQEMDRKGLPLLLVTLANYKRTFHPGSVAPHTAFNELAKQVFDHVAESSHWTEAKKKISSSVAAFDLISSNIISQDDPTPPAPATEELRFFARIIKLYTSNHVYREVNESLRRQGMEGYKATGQDLALGPYTLFLDILLFYWPDLNAVSTKTYRGITLSDEDLKLYKVGTKFVWLSFVSSSRKLSVAQGFGNTLFEFSNDAPEAAFWRPRDLNHLWLTEYLNEAEALYPAGCEFEVTEIDTLNGKRRIKLKLLKAA